jgi:hypothetical protein
MQDLAARFRRMTEQSGLGGRGQRYPEGLREVATAYWTDAAKEGMSRRAAADALGIREATLARWVAASPSAGSRLAPELLEVVVASPTSVGRTMVTPSGYRVEGLSMAELTELLVVLR